ncbi:MAG: glycosyltransferase family 4 protein [Pararhizobium sp.]
MRRMIAFYAPMKPPDHPIASGDREIARLIMRALEGAGYRVVLASRFISYQKRTSANRFTELKAAGDEEAERVARIFGAAPPGERPDLWLTYHPYCKAPDRLGPTVCRRLGIPYATAEACRTRQDTDADWHDGRMAVQAAIRQAAVNFCLKPSDAAYLETVLPSMESVRSLRPFLDLDALPPAPRKRPSDDVPLIVTAGMMRPGKKTRCYLMLGEALGLIADRPWRMVVLGDGPERSRIEQAFARFAAGRIDWRGAVAHEAVIAAFDAADLFAWPGLREPIGMVYLEAQARGLPVAACASLGVPAVVSDGETGLLAPEDDVAAYAAIIARLIDDPRLRDRLGTAGRGHVAARHGIEQASAVLRHAIDEAVG